MVGARRCLAALLILTASCARPSETTTTSSPVTRNPNVISQKELQDPVLQGMDTERAIRYLRPTFFRATPPQTFGNASTGQLKFSLDYGPLQPIGQLATLPPITTMFLYEIRYLDSNDAANRFGLNANGGPVIVLLSNKH